DNYRGLIAVWDLTNGGLLFAVNREAGVCRCLAISPDGRYLALCAGNVNRLEQTDQHALELVELASGKLLGKFSLPPRTWVSSMVFSADGQTGNGHVRYHGPLMERGT